MTGIIRSFFESFAEPDRAKQLVHHDAVLIGVRASSYPGLPLYGTFVGHAGLDRFIGQLQATFDTQVFVIDGELENDEIGYANGRFEHRLRANDALLRSHWAVTCRFRDHRIIHYRFYEDTAALEQAYGVRSTSHETVDVADRYPSQSQSPH
jgi:ketosteroid isomerase-like protein